MNKQEKARIAKHAGHEVEIMDYQQGDPIEEDNGGRFTLECIDCKEILLGNRVMVGTCEAISVT